jgi:hypothetical protein
MRDNCEEVVRSPCHKDTRAAGDDYRLRALVTCISGESGLSPSILSSGENVETFQVGEQLQHMQFKIKPNECSQMSLKR